MPSSPPPAVVALILGPQASGKSTLARALVEALRDRRERVARVELDEIAAMAMPTLPSWDAASRTFASVVGEWARTDVTWVVGEGIASRSELDLVTARVPETAVITTIVMTTRWETAAPRAREDPTRGVSRDGSWLAERYAEWGREREHIDEDLAVDMGELSVEQGVALAVSAIEATRTEQCRRARGFR